MAFCILHLKLLVPFAMVLFSIGHGKGGRGFAFWAFRQFVDKSYFEEDDMPIVMCS